MYDIDYKNLKKGYIFFWPFFLGGLLFFGIGVFLFVSNETKKSQMDEEVKAISVDPNSHVDEDGTTMYSPIYTFEVDGEEFVCSTNGSTNMKVTSEHDTVYYDSDNPTNCMTDYQSNVSLLPIIFAVIGFLAMIVGLSQYKRVSARIKKIKKLTTTGVLYKGLKYNLVESGTIINGRPIMCPQIDYQLSSGSIIKLTGDPLYGQDYDADGLVDLLIDSTDPSNYYIGLEINRL